MSRNIGLFLLGLTVAFRIHASELPKPSVEVERLKGLFVGHWSSDITITEADKKTERIKSEMTCESVGSGFGVQCLLKWMPPPDEVVLLGYDEASKKVISFVVEGMNVHYHAGSFLDGNTLELIRPTCPGCRTEKLTYKRLDDFHLQMNAVLTSPDKKVSNYLFTFTKQLKQKKTP